MGGNHWGIWSRGEGDALKTDVWPVCTSTHRGEHTQASAGVSLSRRTAIQQMWQLSASEGHYLGT